jgi:hypothetical protein
MFDIYTIENPSTITNIFYNRGSNSPNGDYNTNRVPIPLEADQSQNTSNNMLVSGKEFQILSSPSLK